MLRSALFHTALLATFVLAAAASASAGTKADNLLQIESKLSFKQVSDAMPAAAKAHGFAVVTTHPMTEMLKKRGLEVGRQVTVFEVCNGKYAVQVLQARVEMASLLPCRIAVWEQDGKVIINTVKPTVLLGTVADQKELDSVAAAVEAAMLKIMKTAAGG